MKFSWTRLFHRNSHTAEKAAVEGLLDARKDKASALHHLEMAERQAQKLGIMDSKNHYSDALTQAMRRRDGR